MLEELSGAIEALKARAQSQAAIVNALPQMVEFTKILTALNTMEDLCGIERTGFGIVFGGAGSAEEKKPRSVVQVGEFFGKKPLEAAKLYLKKRTGPATLEEIIENLAIGSCVVSDKEELRTSLGRSTFEIARLNENTFDLLERYPDVQSQRLGGTKKRVALKTTNGGAPQVSPAEPTAEPSAPSETSSTAEESPE